MNHSTDCGQLPDPAGAKLSIYLHIPFCGHRCAYCDFNTYAGMEARIPTYVSSLCREVEYVAGGAPTQPPVHTIYFGGGTPSLLSTDQIRQVLRAVSRGFKVEPKAEITLEANPGTISSKSLAEYREAGVNRVSLGVQSANGEELRLLERRHTFAEVLAAVSAVRRAGFENLNLDLIYGVPGQTLEIWKTTVRRVLALRPDHLSAYALTLEHGTPFAHWARRGLLPVPDPDLAADMYEWFSDELAMHGFVQYEISNWARAGFECRHNLQYWRSEPYLGFGAGAHGYADGCRYSNVLSIGEYTDRLRSAGTRVMLDNPKRRGFPCSPAALHAQSRTIQDEMSDFMIMGLRLTRTGPSPSVFRRRFGREMFEEYSRQVSNLSKLGLLDPRADDPQGSKEQPLHLSRRGRLLGNRVFREFI